MALLQWNEKFSVGVKSIDEQHKVLIETLNELHHAIMKSEPRSSTRSLAASLLAYARNHYVAEEQMLANTDYPELKQHQALHRELLQMLQGYLASFERGDAAINVDFLYVLRGWLTNHIQNVDGGYRAWLAGHGLPSLVAAAHSHAAGHTSNVS
jgi:hemerythrin-like metal-binding protein